jgi:hypothetical protein
VSLGRSVQSAWGTIQENAVQSCRPSECSTSQHIPGPPFKERSGRAVRTLHAPRKAAANKCTTKGHRCNTLRRFARTVRQPYESQHTRAGMLADENMNDDTVVSSSAQQQPLMEEGTLPSCLEVGLLV